jgi:hypothetical protein
MIESVQKAGLEPVAVAEPQPGGQVVRSVTLHALAAALMYGAFSTPLVLFAPAAFISSGLRNGRRAVWGTILLAAGIVFAAIVVAGGSPTAPEKIVTVLRLILQIGVPSLAVTAAVRRGVPLGQAVLIGVGLAALGFMVVEVTMREAVGYSPYEATVAASREAGHQSVAAYRAWGWPEENLQQLERYSAAVSDRFMPFVFLSVSALMFLVSLVIIARLPAGRFTADTYLFRNLAWPDGLLLAFVLCGAAPLVRGGSKTFLLNLLAVVAFLYLLQGLAIFRSLVVRMGLQFFGVAVAYALLALLTVYIVAPFVLFLAGLFDPFFDFRNMKRKDETDESHLD